MIHAKEQKTSKKVVYEFPKLMKSNHTGSIAFFFSAHVGVILKSGNGPSAGNVGFYGKNFMMFDWEDYNEGLLLQNTAGHLE
jgi:hypothetical protein